MSYKKYPTKVRELSTEDILEVISILEGVLGKSTQLTDVWGELQDEDVCLDVHLEQNTDIQEYDD